MDATKHGGRPCLVFHAAFFPYRATHRHAGAVSQGAAEAERHHFLSSLAAPAGRPAVPPIPAARTNCILINEKRKEL